LSCLFGTVLMLCFALQEKTAAHDARPDVYGINLSYGVRTTVNFRINSARLASGI